MSKEINMMRKPSCKRVKGAGNNSDCADMRCDGSIDTDPFGSYTGVSTFSDDEEPIQDVDDL